MEALEDIISEIRNDASRDCVYNHEDLRNLANRLERSGEVKGRMTIGCVVNICRDDNWKGVVTAVEERIGGEVNFKVEWRDGRGFQSRWMTKDEIGAFELLEER